MTPDERVNEASLESMDASDPPAHSATPSGAPQRSGRTRDATTLEERIRQRAYELWEREWRQSGRHDEYWHRAEKELSGEAEQASKPKRLAFARCPQMEVADRQYVSSGYLADTEDAVAMVWYIVAGFILAIVFGPAIMAFLIPATTRSSTLCFIFGSLQIGLGV